MAFGIQELEELLEKGDATEESLHRYFVQMPSGNPFSPAFAPLPKMSMSVASAKEYADRMVELYSLDLSGITRRVIAYVKRKRLEEYDERLADLGSSAFKIVAEGDSWFQYPLGNDIIRFLLRAHPLAIKSYAEAGDVMQRMGTGNLSDLEFVKGIVEEQPSAVMFSGGGNDLLGEDSQGQANLPKYLKKYRAGQAIDKLIKPELDAVLDQLFDQYKALFEHIYAKTGFEGTTLVHGYGYALPGEGGGWLQRPMDCLNYPRGQVQKDVVKFIVDRWYDKIVGLPEAVSDEIVVIDCRPFLEQRRSDWWDEIHPTGSRYSEISGRFWQAMGPDANPHWERILMSAFTRFRD